MSWTLRRTVPLLGVQSDSGPSPRVPVTAHNCAAARDSIQRPRVRSAESVPTQLHTCTRSGIHTRGAAPAMVQMIGGKRGRPAKTPKKGPWRPTPPDGKSLKDVAGTVEDLKWSPTDSKTARAASRTAPPSPPSRSTSAATARGRPPAAAWLGSPRYPAKPPGKALCVNRRRWRLALALQSRRLYLACLV